MTSISLSLSLCLSLCVSLSLSVSLFVSLSLSLCLSLSLSLCLSLSPSLSLSVSLSLSLSVSLPFLPHNSVSLFSLTLTLSLTHHTYSYTLECNYNTSRVGNEVTACEHDPMGSGVTAHSPFTASPEKYTPAVYAGD